MVIRIFNFGKRALNKMTQKEIAQQLNISQTTVSQALSGRGRMSEKLRATIQNLAAKEMYTPNIAGQLLRQGKSNLIGVIFNARFEEFYAELHAELLKMFQQRGYLLLTLYLLRHHRSLEFYIK